MIRIYFSKIFPLYKKEVLSYFNSPIAYIIIGIFLIVNNWLFFNFFFFKGQANLRDFFMILPWIFLFLAPAVSMRIWAEEKKSGTAELLLTFPISDWQVVLAKFFGALSFVIIALILTFSLPATISYLGNPDWGPIIGAYLGATLLAGAYLSIGIFISSLSKNQIIAFISSLAVCFVFFIIGADFILIKVSQSLAPILNFLGIGSHFNSISRGVIDSRDLIYYFSLIFFFLWLNVRVIEKRAW
jgi:ABC-2 type transport system permease protein